MIQPDWEISMHMWPMPEPKPSKDKLAEDAAVVEQLGDPLAALDIQELLAMDPKFSGKKEKKSSSKTKNKRSSAAFVDVPPAGPPPPPTHFPPNPNHP